MKVYVVELEMKEKDWPFCEVLCVCESSEQAYAEGEAYAKANFDKCQGYSVEEYDLMKKKSCEHEVYLATDADFIGNADGEFRYIGDSSMVRIPHIIKGVPVTSYFQMFFGTKVTKVISDNPNITTMQEMFAELEINELRLELNTSNVTNMNGMFALCEAKALKLIGFDTSKVIDMSYMFASSKIPKLNLQSFDFSSAESMAHMFAWSKAKTINLSGADISMVSDVSSMLFQSRATIVHVKNKESANKLKAFSKKPDALKIIVQQ